MAMNVLFHATSMTLMNFYNHEDPHITYVYCINFTLVMLVSRALYCYISSWNVCNLSGFFLSTYIYLDFNWSLWTDCMKNGIYSLIYIKSDFGNIINFSVYSCCTLMQALNFLTFHVRIMYNYCGLNTTGNMYIQFINGCLV